MITPGLTSISFRSLSTDEIVDAVAKSGLKAIEWGGDVHVPHGEVETARRVARQTRDAGLLAPSYGSYYRAAESEAEGLDFVSVLDSAEALGTHTIRVWAGKQSSADADAEYRQEVVEDLCRIADMAAAAGMVVATEYHAKTLTDTIRSATQLLAEADHPALLTYWQPPVELTHRQCLESLDSVLPKLANLHVFHWTQEDGHVDRRPLCEGARNWREYLDAVAAGTDWDHHALIEFVRGESLEQLYADAAELCRWTAAVAAPSEKD